MSRGRPRNPDTKSHAEYMREYYATKEKPETKAKRLARVRAREEELKSNPETAAALKEQRRLQREARKAKDPEGYAAKQREITARSRAKRRAEGKGNEVEIAWAKANRAKINARRRERYATEPEYRLLAALRSRLFVAVNRAGAAKTSRTLDLTGCTLQYLRQYLEAQFQPGMAWTNHTLDGWHVDHITPCSAFDLTDPVQQRQCFHYTNLQPLWSDANYRKRAAADPTLLAEFGI